MHMTASMWVAVCVCMARGCLLNAACICVPNAACICVCNCVIVQYVLRTLSVGDV